MASPKILTSFSRYRDAELDQKANFIIDSMTDNAHFPAPLPSIADITTANNEYIAARSAAETGDKEAIAFKNQKREALEYLLHKLGLYVEATANDDEAVLLSSGYSLKKEPEPIGILPKPQNFSVSATEAGMVTLHLKAIHGADSYQYEYRVIGDPQWIVRVDTKSSLLITGLQNGAAYEFRVAGIGAAHERVYSDVLKSFVL